VLRVAALDSAKVPAAPLLVGEVDGQVRVAMSIREGDSIADPFSPTGELRELLAAHAANLRRSEQRPPLLRRLTLRARSAL
jgi:hypothetical protein